MPNTLFYAKGSTVRIQESLKFFVLILGLTIAFVAAVVNIDEALISFIGAVSSLIIGFYLAKYAENEAPIIKILLGGVFVLIGIIFWAIPFGNYTILFIVGGELLGIGFAGSK